MMRVCVGVVLLMLNAGLPNGPGPPFWLGIACLQASTPITLAALRRKWTASNIWAPKQRHTGEGGYPWRLWVSTFPTDLAFGLYFTMLAIGFAPRFLGVLDILLRPGQWGRYGGVGHLLAGSFTDALFTLLMWTGAQILDWFVASRAAVSA